MQIAIVGLAGPEDFNNVWVPDLAKGTDLASHCFVTRCRVAAFERRLVPFDCVAHSLDLREAHLPGICG